MVNISSLRNSGNTPVSQHTDIREPSWISFEERRGSIAFPKIRDAPKVKRVLSLPLRVLALPLKPLRASSRTRERKQEMRPLPRWPPGDPLQPWRSRVRLLEAEVERLNKKYSDVLHDYSKMYTRATNAEKSRTSAQYRSNQLRTELEELSRIVYERYGGEEFRAIQEEIEANKAGNSARRRCTASTTTLTISLNNEMGNAF